jgi:hypothetical protein
MPHRKIQAKSPADMLKEYPIEGKLPNWYFRIREPSASAWLVEGSDVWGRNVSRSGNDSEALLSACVNDAAEIARQTRR